MAVALTEILKKEYEDLFNTCELSAAKNKFIDDTVTKIKQNRNRYETVANQLNIPWYFIGVIHNMEASLNFNKHLHNGDPLTARTTHVPAGRPKTGNPPFTWEESAADALRLKKLDKWTDWSVPGMLFKIEEYNGFGYKIKHPNVKTPYLWSFSNHYIQGKYVADGKWSDTAVSAQCGAAVLLKRLANTGDIAFAPAIGNPSRPIAIDKA